MTEPVPSTAPVSARCSGTSRRASRVVTAFARGRPRRAWPSARSSRSRSTRRSSASAPATTSTSWPKHHGGRAVLRQHPRRRPGGASRRVFASQGRRQVRGPRLATARRSVRPASHDVLAWIDCEIDRRPRRRRPRDRRRARSTTSHVADEGRPARLLPRRLRRPGLTAVGPRRTRCPVRRRGRSGSRTKARTKPRRCQAS